MSTWTWKRGDIVPTHEFFWVWVNTNRCILSIRIFCWSCHIFFQLSYILFAWVPELSHYAPSQTSISSSLMSHAEQDRFSVCTIRTIVICACGTLSYFFSLVASLKRKKINKGVNQLIDSWSYPLRRAHITHFFSNLLSCPLLPFFSSLHIFFQTKKSMTK